MTALGVIIACGLLAIVYGIWAIWSVMQADAGNARMQEIAAAIHEGAQAYLKRQYTTIAIVGVVIFVIVGYLLGWLVGDRLPDRRGALGRGRLHRHERLGARQRAHRAGRDRLARRRASTSPSRPAPSPACWSPASRCSASPCYYAILTGPMGLAPQLAATVIDALVALGFGASLISIFARLGGGIFTKGADVGGDLVGKVEAGIPEDDPRNPATIADNVGDNVGDCAGMAADLFETYAVTMVATMVLAAIFFAGTPYLVQHDAAAARHRRRLHHHLDRRHLLRQARRQPVDHGRALQGPDRHRVLSLVGIAGVIHWLFGFGAPLRTTQGVAFTSTTLFWCGIVGLAVTGLIVWITEYYTGTDYRPVKSIAAGLGHRPRHQRHPGPGDLDGIDRAAGASSSSPASSSPTAGRPVRHRHRRDHHAGAGRHGRRARRLRPGHRQRRRHRRDGGPAQGGAQVDRRARRGRQHHQGGDQGLRHRLGRPRRAGAVRRLQRGPEVLHRQRGAAQVLLGRHARLLADQPLRRRRPAVRRPACRTCSAAWP